MELTAVVCIGGASVDRRYIVGGDLRFGTSNPARTSYHFGGVARNVAENLARLAVPVALISVVGNDDAGTALIIDAQRCGIDARFVARDPVHATAEYAAIVDSAGDLVLGFSDSSAVETMDRAHLENNIALLSGAEWIFADCNLRAEVLAWLIAFARENGVRLAIDAVSEPKARRLPAVLSGIDLLILNDGEAAAYLGEVRGRLSSSARRQRAEQLLRRGAQSVVLTSGQRGLLAACGGEVHRVNAFPARAVDSTGAGDALCAAILYGLRGGLPLHEAAKLGSRAAALTVEAPTSVRADLSGAMLHGFEARPSTN